MWVRFLLFIFILVALAVVGCANANEAGTEIRSSSQPGSISGVITDKETGEPIIGATVQVIGTTFGTQTDLDGKFMIVSLEPGIYTVKVTSFQHGTITISDVIIEADGITDVSRVMEKKISDIDNRTVVRGTPTLGHMGRPLTPEEIKALPGRTVDLPDSASNKITLISEEIETQPVQTVEEILSQVAGVHINVEGEVFIRGGRTGEVYYIVDGEPVSGALGGVGSAGANLSLVSYPTGSITGVITDSTTSEPIVGASVAIVGTTMGAQTDLEGRFSVSKIPVGLHSIRVTTMEYYSLEIDSVNVSELHTPNLRIELVKNPYVVERIIRIPDDPYWSDTTKHRINNQYGIIDSIEWPDRDDSTGLIAGVITDEETGEPIMGVAISIEGDTVGVLTDLEGKYRLNEISAGTKTIKISSIGHVTTFVINVQIKAGQVTSVNHTMRTKIPNIQLWVPSEVDTVDASKTE